MTVKIPRPDLAMVALCALALAGIVTCTLLGVAPPPVLEFVAMTALGAGGGIAVQQQQKAPAPENLLSDAARAAAPAANLPAPAPQPLTVEPPTGVFRPVTHAP